MALIRWTPREDLWDPLPNLADLQEEMNRLLRFGHQETGGMFVPAVDLAEEKDGFLVEADLPGLSKEDVSVTLQDNCLTIKGERRHETEAREANYYRRERVCGSFVRSITLPVTVDAKKIDAQFKDGLLRVRLPKTEEARPKQIEVKVS